MFTYICIKGHVEAVPSMGTLDSCPALEPVLIKGVQRGKAPCGCGIVKVPHDPALEAAYRIGGPAAVVGELRERVLAARAS